MYRTVELVFLQYSFQEGMRGCALWMRGIEKMLLANTSVCFFPTSFYPHFSTPCPSPSLTTIQQEALGGRSKTCIIATVSPSILAVDETVSTLNYAEQVIIVVGCLWSEKAPF